MIFFVFGPVSVTDSLGNLGPTKSINIVGPPDLGPTIQFVTFIGCTLSIMDQRAVVDSRTKLLLSAEPVAIKTGSKWNIWPAMDQQLQEIFDPQIDGVSNAQAQGLYFANISPQRQVVANDNDNAYGGVRPCG